MILLLLCTFFIIFGFSNQSGKESSGISKEITKIITNNIKYIQNLEENQKNEITNRIEKIIKLIIWILLVTLITSSVVYAGYKVYKIYQATITPTYTRKIRRNKYK